MSNRLKISPPIPIPGVELRGLALRDKDLPPTPDSKRVEALERENEMLLKEIRTLNGHIDIQAHQIKRYRQTATAARSFIKEISLGIGNLEDATSKMKETESHALGEWKAYQGAVEKHIERTGTIENII